ncbi:hypothetical protein LUZ60_001127 [Juncus effusus]|nr:hypothetical protein LUZ60_001127 [Juncus effusus]
MSGNNQNQGSLQGDSYSTSAAVTISNGVLLAAIIFLFMVVVFVFLLYLYAKKYMGAGPLFNNSREARFIFVADSSPAANNGLDVAVLDSLPVTVYRVEDFKEGLECSVCLSEVEEGEEARILPKCNHGFHVKCIDMWFHSHTTCPLCRSPVGTDPVQTESDPESVPIPSLDTVPREGYVAEPRAIPTNVLFWGSQNEITNGAVQESTSNTNSTGSRKRDSGTSGMLVIDIPRRAMESMVPPSPISPLPQSVMPLEEMKSPVSARFRSLTMLLSRGKNIMGSSSSPRGGDIEQGIVHTPKTPKS